MREPQKSSKVSLNFRPTIALGRLASRSCALIMQFALPLPYFEGEARTTASTLRTENQDMRHYPLVDIDGCRCITYLSVSSSHGLTPAHSPRMCGAQWWGSQGARAISDSAKAPTRGALQSTPTDGGFVEKNGRDKYKR